MPDWFSPTTPHIGLWGSLTARPQTFLCHKSVPPREFPFLQIRKDEEESELKRIKDKRRGKAKDAVRKRLIRFLQGQGRTTEQATAIARSPTVDHLDESHPDLERYLRCTSKEFSA